MHDPTLIMRAREKNYSFLFLQLTLLYFPSTVGNEAFNNVKFFNACILRFD